MRALSVLLAGLLLGMVRMGIALDTQPQVQTRYSVELTGRVEAEPFTNPDTGRRIFRFRTETVNGEAQRLPLRMYLRGDAEPLEAIAYGQRLRLVGHIWSTDPVTNPYEFDFGSYLRRQGLAAYATAKIEDVTVLETLPDLNARLIGLRHILGRRIEALFPRSAAMMRALMLGDRSLLGEEQREALKRSGTAHLISISGLHVTLLAAAIALLLGRFLPRKTANLLAAALLVPYGMLVGFTAPFVRALSTFAILCCAPVLGLPSDSITRLCAAMLAWLLARPLSIADAGFVLSYAASAGIVLLLPPIERMTGVEALRRRSMKLHTPRRVPVRIALYIASLLCVSLAVQLTTLPYVIGFFGGQPLLSVPFNLVCVPLCMAGYVAGAAILGLSFIAMPVAALMARVPDTLLLWLTDITRFCGALPVAYARLGRYPMALLALHWAVILAVSDLSRLKPAWRRLLPLCLPGIAATASLLIFLNAWGFSITFLDAGQADCAVVCTRGHTYLIDAGDTYTPAADYLNATCLKLDGVFLSHPHQDHAGGMLDVLDTFKPDAIYVPSGWFEVQEVSPAVTEGIEKARDMGIPILEVHTGDRVPLSSVAQLEVCAPTGNALPEEVNDLSMLALISCEGQRALFTGDLSQAGEPGVIPDTDILKVAHHGSSKATSDRFLAAATPRIAVVSVGENNYGHPAAETLTKLKDIGAEVYLTKGCGAVSLRWRSGNWHIHTFREAVYEVE